VAALDTGADDYVARPLDAAELLARLRAALRRAGQLSTRISGTDRQSNRRHRAPDRDWAARRCQPRCTAGLTFRTAVTCAAICCIFAGSSRQPDSTPAPTHWTWNGIPLQALTFSWSAPTNFLHGVR